MKQQKLYIINKYVYAHNASEALRKEKKQHADDIWIDEVWKSNNMTSQKPIGFVKDK